MKATESFLYRIEKKEDFITAWEWSAVDMKIDGKIKRYDFTYDINESLVHMQFSNFDPTAGNIEKPDSMVWPSS